eukprot:831761-Rhodomonas_salina.1
MGKPEPPQVNPLSAMLSAMLSAALSAMRPAMISAMRSAMRSAMISAPRSAITSDMPTAMDISHTVRSADFDARHQRCQSWYLPTCAATH